MSCVCELLTRKGSDVITVRSDMSVLDCTKLMNEHRIGCVPVENDAGQIVGIFSERDVLRRVVAVERSSATTTVAQVMTTDPMTCQPETDLDDVAQIMRDKRIRHLPVMNTDGRLAGMISIGDLNAHRVCDQDAYIQMLNDYVYGRV